MSMCGRSDVIRIISRISKILLILCFISALFFSILLSPALFGYRPFVVTDTSVDDYPVGALAYFRYEAAALIPDETPVAIRTEEGFSVYSAAISEEQPAEWIEGRVAGICIPILGAFCRKACKPVGFIVSGVIVLLLCVGAFCLPKLSYKPKYGK